LLPISTAKCARRLLGGVGTLGSGHFGHLADAMNHGVVARLVRDRNKTKAHQNALCFFLSTKQ
jgi:hypothetical protein